MIGNHTVYHVNKSDIGHTCLKQKYKKNLQINFLSPSQKGVEKERDNKLMTT